ncbi:hypothetical protein ACOJBO_04650 [Rhizobium beringeri]
MTFKTRFLEVGMKIWHNFDATGAVPFYPAPWWQPFRFFFLLRPEDGLTPEIDQRHPHDSSGAIRQALPPRRKVVSPARLPER